MHQPASYARHQGRERIGGGVRLTADWLHRYSDYSSRGSLDCVPRSSAVSNCFSTSLLIGSVEGTVKLKHNGTIMTLPRHIANRELRAEKIPTSAASWEAIERFALTFDGYKHWGSAEACAEIANMQRQGTLSELRTCLFFEQRRWRNQGEKPDGEAMHYVLRLVEQIRHRVKVADDLLA